MWKTFFSFALVCIFFGAYGQGQKFSSEAWHNGYLITSDGDSIRGLLKYDMEANVVQLIKDKVVQTYSSHKVFHFQIYDQILDSYRQFYSIPYQMSNNYEVPIIFELLYEGSLSLLSREAIVQETVNNATSYWGGGGYVRRAIRYTYFFVDKNGRKSMYSGKKADLLATMSRHQSEIKKFIKENRLDVQEIRDIIRITAFYNSL